MSDFQTIFGGGFQTDSVEAQKDFDVLPPGKYPVQIETAVVKPTKAGNGHYAELVLVVLDGPCKNRKLWDRINIDNPNPVCVKIGLSVMAAIGQSLKIPYLQDASQLQGGVLVAHVKVKNEQNEVRTYSSMEAYRAEQAKQPLQAAAAQQPVQQQPAKQPAQQPVQQVAQRQPPQCPVQQPVQQQPPQPSAQGGSLPDYPGSKPPWERG